MSRKVRGRGSARPSQASRYSTVAADRLADALHDLAVAAERRMMSDASLNLPFDEDLAEALDNARGILAAGPSMENEDESRTGGVQ